MLCKRYNINMQITPPSTTETGHNVAALTPVEMASLLDTKEREIVHLRRRIAWFERQIFGQKSERRLPEPEGLQGTLGESFDVVPDDTLPPKKSKVAAHEREQKVKNPTELGDDTEQFFDESKVPVEVVQVPNPEVEGLDPEDYEIIGEKVSHRLAQRPGSYVILKYVRPVIKRRDTQVISCPPAPAGVLDGCRADVSFVAGMMVDKFSYHQPLYRQHIKLGDAGINVSRPWLTRLMSRVAALLEPIFDAQLVSIRASRVKAMDETPIKAGRAGPGKMKPAYFWPVYGEQDEICFLYYPSRAAKHVQEALGLSPPGDAVLQTDGYGAYEHYARVTGITHAQCWAHSRRKVFDCRDVEPAHADLALDYIGALYAVEAQIREKELTSDAKRDYRQQHAKPVLNRFFNWIDQQFDKHGFLPSSPFLGALAYIRERRVGLSVYLDDADVAIDTNHLVRALRVIPMGRRNWLFCWTELGAKHVGIVQSLIATCRMHDINPYDYFVDVLQRISQHPASLVNQLTPRVWKQMFADNPLRSDLHAVDRRGNIGRE